MNKLLGLACSLPLLACVVGSGTDTGDTTGSNGPGGPGGSGGNAVHITTNTMWSGTMNVTSETTVDKGITLTVAAGTVVKLAPSAAILVQGIIDVQGTKASPVQLVASTAGGHWGGFSVATGGELKMTYGVQAGGGTSVEGGKITVTDSKMSQAAGDFLVINSGTANVMYSAIGLEPGAGTDTTHCDLHFGGSGTTITVSHSNISGAPYGLMLYGGNGVDLTYNNWFNNPIQIDTTSGVSADISFGWFDKGTPSAVGGATLTFTNPSATRRIDAGPR